MNEPTRASFLSYASQDADAAQRICDSLRAAGHEVWFDKSDLRGRDAWDAAIRKQVKECALFMPLSSANADARSEGLLSARMVNMTVWWPAVPPVYL